MTLKQISGIIIVLISLYLPSFIAFNILPEGWWNHLFTHWWTLPTGISLIMSSFGGTAVGFNNIFGEL